jgi:membrane-bound lytic murein transglycosylase D
MTFEQISQLLDILVEEVAYFNPQYRKNIIPEGGYTLTLPKEKIALFLNNEDEIYAYIESQKKKNTLLADQLNTQEEKIIHKIKNGETIKSIAKKYNVTVQDIKTWNFIGRKGLRPGKHLIIYKPVNSSNSQTTVVLAEKKEQEMKTSANTDSLNTHSNSTNTPNTTSEKYHVVKKGETIYSIAKKYNIDLKQLCEINTIPLNYKVKIGEKLLIQK